MAALVGTSLSGHARVPGISPSGLPALRNTDIGPARVSGTLSIEAFDRATPQVVVVWTVLNDSDAPQSISILRELPLVASSALRALTLSGAALDPALVGETVTIAPREFRRFRFGVDLSALPGGPTVLRTMLGGRDLSAFADLPAAASVAASTGATANAGNGVAAGPEREA
ncbi:MAG: hypothetical protein H7125_16420, partial [Proteobacteria bacterium]|nr:hypothetical protein [Burkholderiales bacterium]